MKHYMDYFNSVEKHRLNLEYRMSNRMSMSGIYKHIRINMVTWVYSGLYDRYMQQTLYRDMLCSTALTSVTELKKGEYRLDDWYPQVFVHTIDSLSMSARGKYKFDYIVLDTEYSVNDIVDFAVLRAHDVPKPIPLNVNTVINTLNEKFKTHQFVKVDDPRSNIPGSRVMDEFYPPVVSLLSNRHLREYKHPNADLEVRFLRKYWEQL